MKDPNNIDLQSSDPDLGVPQAYVPGGADDLEDYTATVGQWGPSVADALGSYPSEAAIRSRPCPSQPFFHPSKRLTTPFTVAAVLGLLILIIVFIPASRSV
jgi:hypothetical protein